MPNPSIKPETVLINKTAIWIHWLFAILLAAAFVFELAVFFLPSDFLNWPEAALILLAAVSTIASLARQLPLQNVLLAAFVIAIFGGAAHAVGALTGIPFGPFTFSDNAVPEIFKTLPWAMPLLWVVVILNSRGTARLILRPWRKTKAYGFWVIGLTAVLAALFDFALEPFAARVKHYWIWTPTKFPVDWYGAPLVDFVAWALLTLVVLVFVTPALINKQPRKKGSRTFHPLAVWLGGILLFAVACAQRGFWPAVAADAAIGIVTAVFAVRGGTW
ncbi:MAG: carotenoid biosynthesis protein [Limisphaerales bacterium]